MILTNEIFESGKSTRGSWSEAQLNIFGASYADGKGWKNKILNKEVTDEQVFAFLNLKDKHLKNKPQYIKKNMIIAENECSNVERNKLVFSDKIKLEDMYHEISRINKKDVATPTERLAKLFEETGELAMSINKTNGRKRLKENDTPESIRKEIIEEAADSIQNVISIIDGFGFTCEDLVMAIFNKNKKWEENIDRRHS